MPLNLHWFADVIAILVAIGTLVFSAIRLKKDSKKIQAEISTIIDHRWQDLNASLEKRIDELVKNAAEKVKESLRREERITELERIVEEQKKKNIKLENELIAARKRITELKVEITKMGAQLELVKNNTGSIS